jgi:hypothetical protein
MRTKWEELALKSIKKQFDEFVRNSDGETRLISYMMRVTLTKRPRAISIIMIGIDHDHRGKGLCRDFVDYVENYCSTHNMTLQFYRVLSRKLIGFLGRRGYRSSKSDFFLYPEKIKMRDCPVQTPKLHTL